MQVLQGLDWIVPKEEEDHILLVVEYFVRRNFGVNCFSRSRKDPQIASLWQASILLPVPRVILLAPAVVVMLICEVELPSSN